MFPIAKAKISDFKLVVDYINKTDYANKKALKGFYNSVVNESQEEEVIDTPRVIFLDKDELIKLLLPLIKTNRINSNILNLLISDKCTRDSEYIYYVKKNIFNVPIFSDILILSATVNKFFTKIAYPDAKFIDLGQIKYKGSLYQVPARSMSRSCIRQNTKGFSKYCDKLSKKYLGEDYNVITYPEFYGEKKTDKDINLWNCLGLDSYQDKDLVVIGTPHCPATVYRLLASVVGLNINDTEQDYRLISRNGFNFYFQTFSYSKSLQEIQLYMIESILMQDIGRARLVNNEDRKVLLLSNFILPQAKVFNYTQQEVRELLN